MNGSFLAAATLTLLSLAGYVLGTVEPYPGREASLVGLSVGVTLAIITYGRGRAVADDRVSDGGESS